MHTYEHRDHMQINLTRIYTNPNCQLVMHLFTFSTCSIHLNVDREYRGWVVE